MEQRVSYHEFEQLLLDTLNDVSEIEILIASNGDFVKDKVLEVRKGSNWYRFSPYQLYQKAKEDDNYETVIEELVSECKLALLQPSMKLDLLALTRYAKSIGKKPTELREEEINQFRK